MKKFLTTLLFVFTLFSLFACKPGVYMSTAPGPVGAAQSQNTTVMAEALVPTASVPKK
jgi:hypothetical protein